MTNNSKHRQVNDPARLSGIPRAFFEAPDEERIRSIARLAAERFGMPMALVALTGDKSEYFRCSIGVPGTETAWADSFSALAMLAREPLCVVPDAAIDPRLVSNALVHGTPHVKFCAGAKILAHDGTPVGSLFVFDSKLRPDLNADALRELHVFARHVALELEFSRVTADLRLFAASAEQADDAIYFARHSGPHADPAIVYANASFERMTGYRLEEVRGASPIRLLFRADSPDDTMRAIRGAIKMESAISLEAVNYRKDGSSFLADITFSPVFNERGECTHWISVRRDVTAHRKVLRQAERDQARIEAQARIDRAVEGRERAEEVLNYLAFHDVLTGLPNRSLLLQEVGEGLRSHDSATLLFINLDRFKLINDTFGRAAADAVLSEISERLRDNSPVGSILARLEADSFVVWIRNHGELQVELTASALLTAVSTPFVVSGESMAFSASIGVASNHAMEYERPEDLLRDADIAMHRAKQLGGNRYHIFSPELHSSAATRLRVEMNLRRALENDEFVLHYQPIVSLETGRIVALEALLRWNDPERGVVPPALFIPIAEQSGQILAIGRRVLERACFDAMQWTALEECAPPAVNVNISAKQLADETLADLVLDVLKRSGLPPSSLCLEITETAFVENVETAVSTLHRIRLHGVTTAMDDFGTGYSSLAYLRRFPFQNLKIDRSFISGDSSSDGIADPDIVQTIVSLGGARGLPVTAEGVETPAQLAQARELGCARAQGYYLAKPQPLDAILALLPHFNVPPFEDGSLSGLPAR